MFFIFKFIFFIVGLFLLMTIVTGLSFVMRIRQHLQNPFQRHDSTPPPPPGKGDIIEGEYKVLDEDGK